MAGHTSEKRWRQGMNPQASREPGVSQSVSNIAEQMINALTNAEAAYAEMQEIYQFAGSTIQGIADLLFTEDIANRQIPGTDAVITVDVATGVVSSPVVTTAGSGYVDGTYDLTLTATAGGGNNDAVLRYTVSGGSVTGATIQAGGTGYTDGLDYTVTEMPPAGLTSDTQANAEEVGKVQDAFDAVTALHELYQAANNQVVAQEDRLAQLRRMT